MFVRRLWAALALAVSVVVLAPATAGAASDELFFSEYIEGSSNNKALEIFNDTGASRESLGRQLRRADVLQRESGLHARHQPDRLGRGRRRVRAREFGRERDDSRVRPTRRTGRAGSTATTPCCCARTARSSTPSACVAWIRVQSGAPTSRARPTTRSGVRARSSPGDTNDTDAFDPALQWDGFPIDTVDGLGGHGTGPVIANCGGPLTLLEGSSGTRTVTAVDADDRVVDIAISSISPAPASGSIVAHLAHPGIGRRGDGFGDDRGERRACRRATTRSRSRPRTTTRRRRPARATSS